MTIGITEIFESVQGETTLVGLPTTFVRLSQCNLRCSWCDTPYSFSRGNKQTIESIIDKIEAFGHRHVCITGGEPLLQSEVLSLMEALCDKNFIVSIETGGSLSTEKVDPRVTVILDIKCPGSQMSDRNLYQNIDYLKAQDEVKFVILNEEDYAFAKQVCEKYNLLTRPLLPLFSPVFNQLEAKSLVKWILRDRLPVRLNLQTHKFIWHPTTRGV